MEKRTFKKTGDKLSLLGFGGMRFPKIDPEKDEIDEKEAEKLIDYAYQNGVNYFDTAYLYHGGASEGFMGKALSKYQRESFYVATKMPAWILHEQGQAEKIFEEQLKRLQVDYFDFYLLHSVGGFEMHKYEKYDIFNFLEQKRKEGKIKNLGFSFHDTPELLEKFVTILDWDFAQIQLNYVDFELQNAKAQYEILTNASLPIVVMEPVRGGALANLGAEGNSILKKVSPDQSIASFALRYAASLPNVLTVLSGMSTLEQVKDNIETFSPFKPLSETEYAAIDKARLALLKEATIPCTGCRYCMDCPFGLNIPKLFDLYNQYKLGHNKIMFSRSYSRRRPRTSLRVLRRVYEALPAASRYSFSYEGNCSISKRLSFEIISHS